MLDGTLIEADRGDDAGSQCDRWYSGKHRHHGGLVQVVTDGDGRPLSVSQVDPDCTHDLIAARIHALSLLYVAPVVAPPRWPTKLTAVLGWFPGCPSEVPRISKFPTAARDAGPLSERRHSPHPQPAREPLLTRLTAILILGLGSTRDATRVLSSGL